MYVRALCSVSRRSVLSALCCPLCSWARELVDRRAGAVGVRTALASQLLDEMDIFGLHGDFARSQQLAFGHGAASALEASDGGLPNVDCFGLWEIAAIEAAAGVLADDVYGAAGANDDGDGSTDSRAGVHAAPSASAAEGGDDLDDYLPVDLYAAIVECSRLLSAEAATPAPAPAPTVPASADGALGASSPGAAAARKSGPRPARPDWVGLYLPGKVMALLRERHPSVEWVSNATFRIVDLEALAGELSAKMSSESLLEDLRKHDFFQANHREQPMVWSHRLGEFLRDQPELSRCIRRRNAKRDASSCSPSLPPARRHATAMRH